MTGGTATRRIVVALQLGGVAAVGGLGLPLLRGVLLIGLFGGVPVVVGVALAGAVVGFGYLFGLVSATATATRLGSTVGGRLLWMVLVGGLGTAGWLLGWAVTDVLGWGIGQSRLLTLLLGGVPFVLVAGALLAVRWVGPAAAVVSVFLLGTCIVVLRAPSPDELDARLNSAGVHRETAYAVAIPGYRPDGGLDYGNGLGGGSFTPTDPAAIPPDRFITIIAYGQVLAGKAVCGQPTAQDGHLTYVECAVEAGGLVYRHNDWEQGYQVLVGTVYIQVVGTPAVDHDVLRAAATSLRLATAAELGGLATQDGSYYAATIPGYVGLPTGIPAGMVYQPTDHTGSGAHSVSIQLTVSYADTDACMPGFSCTPDGPDVTYLRGTDSHGFRVRHGTMDVIVVGGLRVDRALLRRAAQSARPATDTELGRALPQAPPHGIVGRLRHWLREL